MANHAIDFGLPDGPEAAPQIKAGDTLTVIDRDGATTELLVKTSDPAEDGGRRITFDSQPPA